MNFLNHDKGFALPVALLLMLVLSTTTALLAQRAGEQLGLSKGQEASQDTFMMSDGAFQDQVRRIAMQAEAWKTMVALPTMPQGYQTFQPANFAATNGIPTCSGIGCMRNRVPTGGGLIKNVGPLTGDGSIVDGSYEIGSQLDFANPPSPDITFNNRPAWVQVERLDKQFTPEDGMGANLTSQGNGFGNTEMVRYRVTSYSVREVKTKVGQSTIVAVIQIPAS